MKNKFKKQIVALALSLIMLICIMPMSASAVAYNTYDVSGRTQSGNNKAFIRYGLTDDAAGIFSVVDNGTSVQLNLALNDGWYLEKWDTWFNGGYDKAWDSDPSYNESNPNFDDRYTFFNMSQTALPTNAKFIFVSFLGALYGDFRVDAVVRPILTVNAGNGVNYRVTANNAISVEQGVAVEYGKNASVTYSVDDKHVITGISANYGTQYADNGSVVTVSSIVRPATVNISTRLKRQTVNFNANGGDGTMAAQTFEHSVAQGLTANAFTKNGYTFAGWNTKADNSGTSYANMESVSFTPANDGDSITLYAQWTQCTDHNWEGGKCTKCGALCSHSGGNATCIEQATCDICGEKYGDLAKHNVIYNASQNRIVETCTAGCGHQAIADIIAGEAIYTGSAITNTATISCTAGTWIGDEPVLSFENNVNVGTATAKMTAGDATASTTFKINPANISYTTITLDPENGTYNGSAYTPNITVAFDGAPLVKDTDYTLYWDKSGFTNAGSYTATITGKGNFEGTKNTVFSINPVDIKSAVVTLDQNTFVYDGQPHRPTVSVTFNGATLTEDVDYEVYYLGANQIMKWENGEPVKFFGTGKESCDSINAGQYFAVVFGKGNFADNGRFAYAAYNIEKATVSVPTFASKPYNEATQAADIPASDLYTVVKNDGGIDAGNYDVVLKLNDGANYKWATTDNAEVTLQFKIVQAKNAWVTTPSITGWTYGEIPNTPVGEAKFGTVYVLYDGTANDGTTHDSDTPPTKAGSYVARFFEDGTANYEPIGDGVEFTIAKADQAAPTGLTKTDITYFGKADGKISGLTSAMEFRKEGDSAYTAGFDGTLEYLAAGTYYVRYQGDANHNPSPDAVVTVNDGRKLQIVVPQNQVGYTVTVNKTEMEYEGSYTLKVEIHEGYTATENFKIIISNWECGQQAGVEETYMNAIADQIIEVQGVADITPPAAEIKVKENRWTSFLNDLTFGLIFNETQDVTITATDKGSGVNTIQYYLADGKLSETEVEQITEWEDYNGTFKIDPNSRYVVYAKITDNAGNTLYINSDGIVLDNIAPTLEGIENGKTYYGDLTVIKSDEQFYDIKMVTLDGEPMGFAEGTYDLIPADNVEHTVVVEDHAGNKTTYTVTVMKNYTVTYKADGVVVDTLTVGHGKDATPPAVPAKAGYTGKWDHDGKRITSDIVINAVYTENSASAPSDPQSPQTGDNSHMMLWIALLLISGGALITLTVVDRKRRMASKR